MFKIHQDQKYIMLEGGMSTEICLTKYLSNRSNKVYQGWKPTSFFCTGNIIHETIMNICTNIINVTKGEKRCVFSPGILSIPYVVELTDSMYLPSQLLLSVKSLDDLDDVLKYAKFNGIKCYAEVGYDGCMPEGLVAWIKFLEIPKLFIKLLTALGVSDIITICVNKIGIANKGENIARFYKKEKTHTYSIQEGSILFLYINEGYNLKTKVEEETLFSKLVKDFNPAYVREQVDYIQDWESGITDPYKLLNNWKKRKYIICAPDTLQIYNLSWYLTREFIKINGIKFKGFVMNPYFINNPLYEAYYGYLAYNYWQQNPNALNNFRELKDGIKGELWVNTIKGGNNVVNQLNSDEIHTKIEMSSPYSNELADWIYKYRPGSYSNIQYISLFNLKRICKNILHMEVYEEIDMSNSGVQKSKGWIYPPM
jgi:hypothetical protein